MLNTVRRLPTEAPVSSPRDEGPLDAYSRVVTDVVDRAAEVARHRTQYRSNAR